MDSQSRQEYVRAAISFLQNPKLIDSPLKDKLRFLKDKGLSDLEVDEALNLALSQRHQSQGGKWNFLLILGICVGGYKLYQAYLEQKANKATAEPKDARNVTVQPTLTSENTGQGESSATIAADHPTLSEILKVMSELKQLIELQRSNFRQDVQSLKTLLLGHEKFAAPPKIPEWQMAAEGQNSTGESAKLKKPPAGRKAKAAQVTLSNGEGSAISKTTKFINGTNETTEVIAPSP